MHEVVGLITVVIAIIMHVPYLIGTIKGTIKPHPFTWILWTLLTLVVFFAQFTDGAGPGAWGTGIIGVICIFITLSCLHNGFKNIKKSDIVLFVIGLSTIPLWFATNDPTLSVVIVTVIDVFAFAPTFRKSYMKPYDEPLYLYSSNVARHALSLFAITNVTIATVFFPFVIMIANIGLTGFLIWRRRVLKRINL
jgi:hypothetical protein